MREVHTIIQSRGHAALIQPHLAEGLLLGLAFAAATAALALAALAVRQPRHDAWAPAAATAVLCLIAVSYLLSRTTGIPLLIGQAEQLDPPVRRPPLPSWPAPLPVPR